MSYIKLTFAASSRPPVELREEIVRLGRDPFSTIAFSGDEAKVVSTHHAELRWRDGAWRLADQASRNGTYLNGQRLATEATLKQGDEIGLGESGPRLSVVAVEEALVQTLVEYPGVESPPPPAVSRAYGVTVRNPASGKRYEARGVRIRIGRGSECEIQPVDSNDTVVSRVHAELTVGPSGGLSVRDTGSRNGTFLNGKQVMGGTATPVRLGDKIMLGNGGPVLEIEVMEVEKPSGARGGMGQKTVMAMISDALAKAKEERKQGHRGSTAFLKAVAAEVGKDSRRKIRWLTAIIVLLVLILGGGVYGVYWLLSTQMAQSERQSRSAEDSSRADATRLRQELEAARQAAAPASQVDSLRAQLESAQAKTAALQAALGRAQSALTQQLADGEARRSAAQQDVERLRDELSQAEKRAPSQGMIDSLRHAVAQAETQTASLDARMRAIRGTDFAAIAQQNQAAVGLITVDFGKDYYNGTGFAITPDGYMLTNWHVVADSAHSKPDTVWVTMADQSVSHFADVIATSQERDLAVIKIRGYQGPYLSSIDWSGTKARQGEPAALIGFPAGMGFARLRSAVVRTSMTAGIISRLTEDVMQFDGMTIGGSSGSPVFNADGQVISVHRAGLPQAPGFALSVPIRHALPILPEAVRTKLGVPQAE